MLRVKAKTYGIDYQPIEKLNLRVDEIKKYKFYKEKSIKAYFIEDENPEDFKKQTDYYETNYSEWLKERPEMKKNRQIKERDTFIYQKLKKIKNFYIEVFDDDKPLVEFAIYFNDLPASNNAFCLGCTDLHYMYASDNKYDTAFGLKNWIVNYNEFFEASDLKIKVMFNKENVKYRIVIYGDNKDTDILYEKEALSDLALHEYTIADFDVGDNIEYEIFKYEETDNMVLKETYKEYAYKDRYYLYELIQRDYYPKYEEKLDGYIKDESDFITEKKYYYLETATIKDNIVINSDNYDLKDYIKTSLPFETASNIDISKNGNYKIKYIFQNKTIEQNIQVKTNREYIESLEMALKNKNEEIDEVINNKNEIIERLESNIRSKDEIISKKSVERMVSKQNPIPIILITIGIMLIVICIVKSFRKNVELKK